METLSPHFVETLSKNFQLKACTALVSFEGKSYRLKQEKGRVQVQRFTPSIPQKKIRLIFIVSALLLLGGMMAYSYSQVGELPSSTIIEMTLFVLVLAVAIYSMGTAVSSFFNQGDKKQIERSLTGVDTVHFVESLQQKYQVQSWEACQVEFEGATFHITSSKGKVDIVQSTPFYLFVISMLISGFVLACVKPELLNNGRIIWSAVLPALLLNIPLSGIYLMFNKSKKIKFISAIEALTTQK